MDFSTILFIFGFIEFCGEFNNEICQNGKENSRFFNAKIHKFKLKSVNFQ